MLTWNISWADTSDRPNIVVILADDMGFSDIGSYGSEIETPHLDQLAQGGLRYRQFYNAARCCPTRASLLTGLYPHQAGMGWMTPVDMQRDGYRGEISRECTTIAEALAATGYGTYMAGKWHLTREDHLDAPQESWPTQRGFDRYFGTLMGSSDYFQPEGLLSDDTFVEPAEDFYLTDAISDAASNFITGHIATRAKDPFFLYAAYTAPHWPMQAIEEDIERYRERYRQGWDALRAQRYAQQKKFEVGEGTWPLSMRDQRVKEWASLDDDRRASLIERMAIYAAMVDRMDQGIGRLISTLKKTGQFENTLILFLSDNGGNWEGGIWGWNLTPKKAINTPGSNVSYGQSWANLSNTPFREYKSHTHEGGIATPLIAHWPQGIEESGTWRNQVGHVMDIMPTCLDAAGIEWKDHDEGPAATPLEGRSLLPTFQDISAPERTLIWEHEGNRAIRKGNWKLVAKGLRSPWELYDLTQDRAESKDLAQQFPEKANELEGIWNEEAARTKVLPLDGTSWFLRLKKYDPNNSQ